MKAFRVILEDQRALRVCADRFCKTSQAFEFYLQEVIVRSYPKSCVLTVIEEAPEGWIAYT